MKASTSQYISLIGMYFAEDILHDSEENKVNGTIGLICTAVGGKMCIRDRIRKPCI